jgi:hypothetical protein
MTGTERAGGRAGQRSRLKAPPRLTPAERATAGKAARAVAPRGRHAIFEPAPGRPDPVSLLEQQAATRIGELVQIRYGRMLASPLAFFRGAALPMAADLAGTPRTGLTVQLSGDAHLSNFGVFASPERRLVFDINDFDETLPGPWEWDIKRLAASLEVAARDSGITGRLRRQIVVAAAARYRRAMRHFARRGNVAVWYAHAELDELQAEYQAILGPGQRKVVASGRARGRAASRYNLQEFRKLTHEVAGRPRINADPPLLVPLAELEQDQRDGAGFDSQLGGFLARYRRSLEADRRFLLGQFEVADMARRVSGVGSAGMRCWIVLLLGRDADDPLFLQVKEADRRRSAPSPAPASTPMRASASFPGSGSCRHRATFSWAGSGLVWGPQARPVTSTSASCAIGSSRSMSSPCLPVACASTANYAAGRWRGRTPGPATGSRSARTLAVGRSSTGPSASSPLPMPTRTSVTTRLSGPRWPQAG